MEKDSSGIIIISRDEQGYIKLCESTVAIPTDTGKFSFGCVLIGNDGKTYKNTSLPTAAASFQDFDEVTTSEIADGAITDVKLSTSNVGSVPRTATATADGLTTGTLSAGSQYVTVTSANSGHFITLPAPVVGTQVVLNVGSNGFKLQTSAPATVAINGGTGASASSTIAASSTCFLTCVSSTEWKGFFLDADSDVAKIAAAA